METVKGLFHKYFIPTLLSLLVGMLNTYHKEAREQRAINLAAVQKASVQNDLQDEKLLHISNDIRDIKEAIRQQALK